MSRISSQDQDLRPVILHMILSFSHFVKSFHSINEDLTLSGATPISLGVGIVNVEAEDENETNGDAGNQDIKQKHDD